MKIKVLHITGGLLGLMAIVMIIGGTLGRAEDAPLEPYGPNSFVDLYCFDGKLATMDVSDIVNVYTKATNDYFNEQIKKLMKNPQEALPTPDLNDYKKVGGGLCTSTSGAEDLTCMSIAVCNPETPDTMNLNPYCMGVTLLGVPPAKYDHYDYDKLKEISKNKLRTSYFCYKAALDKKRDDLFDSTPQGILAKCDTSEFADKKICSLKKQVDEEKDANKKNKLRQDLSYELNQKSWWSTSYRGVVTSMTANLIDLTDSLSKKISFIDQEEVRAKNALDQALDAYSQMRWAWQLHTRYMDIFSELVKYRDHIVAIRKSTDAFPIKFIDATTTKCL